MLRFHFPTGIVVSLVLMALLFTGCSDDDCPVCEENSPLVSLNTHKVDFGATSTSASIVISNRGSGSLPWEIEISYRQFVGKAAEAQQGDWLSVSATSGDGDGTVFLTADREELGHVGMHRAVVYINTPSAQNQTRDSVEVYILSGGEWIATDDGTYETCVSVDEFDYYWVKRFSFPENTSGVFVDSIAFNFCEADTLIQVMAFEETVLQPGNVRAPGIIWRATPFSYEVLPGRNVLAFDWHIPFNTFFVGYFQLALSPVPRLQVDTDASDADSTSWKAADFDQNHNNPSLGWQQLPNFETFAIQIYVTPVLPYNPKMAASYRDLEGIDEASLQTGFAYKGKYPISPKPSLDK